MSMESPTPRRWFLRFGRLTLKGSVALGLVVGVSVFAARIPDQYACLQLVNGYARNSVTFDLVDLNSGQDALDSRGQQALFGIPSPDGKFSALLQSDKPGAPDSTSSLIIQRVDGSASPRTSTVVRQGIADTGGGYGRSRNLRWSPDSSRLAYLWFDGEQKIFLSVVNADGSDQQTALYGVVPTQTYYQNSSFAGASNSIGNMQVSLNWSADHNYLSIGQAANGGGTQITLWSIAKLSHIDPANHATLHVGAWATQANRFVAVAERPDGTQQIVVWEPDRQASLPFAAGKIADQVIWSPDGQYAALQSHRPCTLEEGCADRWSYDIVGSDGTLKMGDIDGVAWTSSSSGQATSSPSVAAWSADSAAWVFMREESGASAWDAIALHMADGRFETLAANVVSDLAADMLYGTQARRGGPPQFNLTRGTLARQRIVLPTWHEGRISVELADLDGQHRTTLVEGADTILDAQSSGPGGSSRFWSPGGDLVVVVWATGTTDQDRRVHLTWAQADGSGKHEIGSDINDVSHLQVITSGNQRWLGYTAKRADRLSIELAEVATGQHYRLLDNLQDPNQWLLTPAPDGSLAALQLGASTGRFYGESTLYLVALDGTAADEVSNIVTGPAQWSPDGSQLAFLRGTSGSSQSLPYVEVITPDRSVQRSVPLYQAGTNQPRILRWSKCA